MNYREIFIMVIVPSKYSIFASFSLLLNIHSIASFCEQKFFVTILRHLSPALMSQESILKAHPREKCISPETTPMKDLIAAAQARRLLSRCMSFSENHIDSKNLVESPIDSRDGSSVGQPSPLNPVARQIDGRGPNSGARGHAESHAARKAFEAFLFTLTRTKDSIGRATRLGMECAKYGNAGEVSKLNFGLSVGNYFIHCNVL
jgi:hypothetical protein